MTTATENFKNSIIFSGGEKGGVGKSFLIRILLDFILEKGWKEKILLIDADPTIDDVSSIFKDQNCEKIIFSDNKFGNQEPNIILDKVTEKTVIVNLPSNVSIQFDEWIERVNILSPEVQTYYEEILYFFVTDGCYRSIERFVAQLDKYQRSLSHCLVLNPGRLTCGGDFRHLQNYSPLMKTIKKYEVPIIVLPELPSNLQFECDRKNISYRELLNKPNGKISDKQNTKKFISKADNLFDKIFPNQIGSPEGLKKIVKEQQKSREEERLFQLK